MMLPRPAATDPLSIKSLGGSVCSAEHATEAASRRTALVSLSIQTDASRHSPLCRKLLHISPGLLAFLLPLLPHTKPLSTQALVEITVITSLLTLYAVTRVWTKAFWRTRADAPEGDLSNTVPAALIDDDDDIAFADRDDVGRMPVGMLLPTGALIAVGLALTVFAGPIYAYSERAADEILDRSQYISAVLRP